MGSTLRFIILACLCWMAGTSLTGPMTKTDPIDSQQDYRKEFPVVRSIPAYTDLLK